MYSQATMGTRGNRGLVSVAFDVIESDWSRAFPEFCPRLGGDCRRVTELPTNHSGVVDVPRVIADGGPLAFMKDLDSALVGTCPIDQTNYWQR